MNVIVFVLCRKKYTKIEFVVVLPNFFYSHARSVLREVEIMQKVPHIYNSKSWFYHIIFKLNHEQLYVVNLDIYVYWWNML